MNDHPFIDNNCQTSNFVPFRCRPMVLRLRCFVAAGHPWGDAAFWLWSEPWMQTFTRGALSRKRPAVSPPQPVFAPAAVPRLRACGPPPDASRSRTSPSQSVIRHLPAARYQPPPASRSHLPPPQPAARYQLPPATPASRSHPPPASRPPPPAAARRPALRAVSLRANRPKTALYRRMPASRGSRRCSFVDF